MDRRMSRDRRMDMLRRKAQDMRDRRRGRNGYDMGNTNRYGDSEYTRRYGDSNYPKFDYTRKGMGYQSSREYDRHYEYPYYMSDYNYDMARSKRTGRYIKDYGAEEYLSDEELMEWSKDLLNEVDQQMKGYFTKDNIERKAMEMGIKYNDYTFAELYTVALMLYDDYKDVIGGSNPDIYLKLANAWFDDEDAELTGSEKLKAYYDEIVCPE